MPVRACEFDSHLGHTNSEQVAEIQRLASFLSKIAQIAKIESGDWKNNTKPKVIAIYLEGAKHPRFTTKSNNKSIALK